MVEDDRPDPIKKESFKVKAVAMLSTKFPASEGDELEIYGTISTRKILGDNGNMVINGEGDEQILWKRNTINWVGVGSAETVINSEGSEHIYTITEEELTDGASIWFYAEMWDKDPDGNPDDYLGETYFQVSAQLLDVDKPNYYQLTLFKNNITLLVRFIIERTVN